MQFAPGQNIKASQDTGKYARSGNQEATGGEMIAELQPKKDLLARLNEEQKQAVSHGWGPTLVVAGAGSGKTTVLTRRIAYLTTVLDQDPASILAVTFTNKAAQEMKARVETIVGKDSVRWSTIGTFHSICARLLRQEIENYKSEEGHTWSNNFVIYDETDSQNVMKGVVKRLNLDEKVFHPKEMKYAISALKNDGYTCQLYSYDAKTYRETRISDIFNAYQAELAKNNALDFDDLILIFSELLKKNINVRQRLRARFRHVLVDEFQDTNKVQYEMVRLLTHAKFTDEEEKEKYWTRRSLMVVGDVDQSIYSWRKADYRIFLGFKSDYQGCTEIKLEENYRSTSNILDVANSIIVNNTERIDKVLRCNKGKGARAQFYEAVDEIDESFYVVEELKRLKQRGRTYNDAVILYRTNAQSRAIEEILIRADIPYKVVGGTRFYDRQEIKDMVAYLKLVFNPKDGQSFNRVVNSPRRGIGKTSLEKLYAYAEQYNISYMEAAEKAAQIGSISSKTQNLLKEFAYNVVNRWRAAAEESVSGLIELILKDTRYIQMLEEQAESKNDELAYGRIENIREFIAVAQEFESIADEPDLDAFLTRISLVSDLDQVEMEDDCIKLMTLHSAKGLEFPVVFLLGLEDGLFPHSRSLEDPSALEEERRLMYVGVTRAEDLLYITRARKRTMIGRSASGGGGFQTSYTIPSRFLKEITPGLLTGYHPEETAGYDDPSLNEDGLEPGSYGQPAARKSSFGGSGYSDSGFGSDKYGNNNYGGGYGSSKSNRGNQRKSGSGSGRFNSKGHSKPRVIRQGQGTPANFIGSAPKAPEETATFEKLREGDRINHKTFGEGEVIKVLGTGGKELYNIKFSDKTRVLDPRFAKLIKL